MDTEIGRKYPCFGDFKCPRCLKKWQSSKAWTDYGQQCKFCSTSVKPTNLQKLFIYICEACEAIWSGTYESEGQLCKKCSSSVLVYPLDRENFQDRQYIRAHKLRKSEGVEDDNYINSHKQHRQDLCEKCQRFGRLCYTINSAIKTDFTNNNRCALPIYKSTSVSYSHDKPIQRRLPSHSNSNSNHSRKATASKLTPSKKSSSGSCCIIA